MPISVISTWHAVEKKPTAFYIFLLLLESAMIGVFVSLDLLVVLCFRSVSRPDVFLDRYLGRRKSHLRGGQVLHFHGPRQFADAGGDHLAILRARECLECWRVRSTMSRS
jgi:hypothetical protein